MFFTRVLQFYKKFKKVPGSLRSGKHQARPHISVSLKRTALQWMMLEQQNMEILSRPYLTKEEEYRSGKYLREKDNFLENVKMKSAENMIPHRTAKDIFINLYKHRSWE